MSTKRSPLFHATHLGLSFCLVFLAFSVAQNSQTSLSAQTGAISLSLLYAVFTLSNTFSSFIVARLGLRISLLTGATAYVLYVVVNIYTIDWLLYTASCVIGLGAAVLWTAQGAFISSCATAHEQENGLVAHSQVGYFNGLFFSLFQTNQFAGNLIAALLYQWEAQKNLVFTVMSILCALGVLIMFFLPNGVAPSVSTDEELLIGDAPDSAEDPGESLVEGSAADVIQDIGVNNQAASGCWQGVKASFASLALLADRRFFLLIVIIVYTGCIQSFIYGALPPMISSPNMRFYVLSFLGASDAISSYSMGRLSDRIGKVPILLVGTVAHGAVYLYFLLFASPRVFGAELDLSIPYFFLIAFAMALGDGVFNSCIYAILGSYFSDRASQAYANFKMFQSGSTALLFLYTAQNVTPTVFSVCLISFALMTIGMALLLLGRVLSPFSAVSTQKTPAIHDQ